MGFGAGEEEESSAPGGVVGYHQLPEHGAVLDLFKMSKNGAGSAPGSQLGSSTGRELLPWGTASPLGLQDVPFAG